VDQERRAAALRGGSGPRLGSLLAHLTGNRAGGSQSPGAA